MATFPGTGSNSLGVKVELLLNSVWTDVTAQVRLRNPIQITGMGRADWTSALQAAQLTLTLNNRSGNFSPKNTGSIYFPYITRNVQLRVSVNATSVTSVAYSGFRFWGEVAEWPPQWDVSGRDVWCDITAAGIWQRMSQLATTLGSAYTRYNTITLTGGSAPRSYWPFEDGTGSGQLVAYGGTATTANAVQSFVTGTAGLSLAASSSFPGSDMIPQFNGAKIVATVPAGGTATNNVTRFLLSVPAAGDSAAGTTNWNLIEVDAAGTVAKFEVYLNFAGTLAINLRNSGGTIIASGTTTTNVQNKPVLCSCELTPSGGNVAFAFRIITPGAAGITESLTGTLTTATVGAISAVTFNRANVLMDTAVGGLFVGYGAPSSMVSAAYAVGGYVGEFAMTRFTRICGEMGIATETIGTASATAAMGPQVDDTLTNVLQQVENTDMGLLYETVDQFGLGYRGLPSMANQSVAATLSYTGAVLDPALAPVYDDQLTRNNVTVTNWTGYTQQAILTAGAMSVLNPPSGIGNGYAYTRTVAAALDSQTAGIATWLLNLGSVDEVRIPTVTIRMVRPQAASLFATIPGLRPGDYIQITNPPSFFSATALRQLVWGYAETMGIRDWTFTFNTVPETPYETGFSPGTVQTAQLPGSGATVSQAPNAGGIGALIQNGSIVPAMLSNGITVHTLGGSAITISASAPATPNVNDIWIASATGLISQWNGSSWAPFKFDASSTIQAATIITANIAASAITSSLIAAGTVVAGIVDATTVQAAQYIATGTQGEFLAYSGTPALGNLNAAISGFAGTDGHSNPYPLGLMAQALTLPNQASGPAAFTGASVFYSSTANRPRYLNAAGNDSVLERSVVNVTNFAIGSATTAQTASSTLTYLANEGAQSSEYEVEIYGGGIWSNPASQALNVQFNMDGSVVTNTEFRLGSGWTGAGFAYAGVIRYIITFTGGSPNISSVQGIGEFGTSIGNANALGSNSVVGAALNTSVTMDLTVGHTFLIDVWWNGSGGGNWTTYRTKLTRRM